MKPDQYVHIQLSIIEKTTTFLREVQIQNKVFKDSLKKVITRIYSKKQMKKKKPKSTSKNLPAKKENYQFIAEEE